MWVQVPPSVQINYSYRKVDNMDNTFDINCRVRIKPNALVRVISGNYVRNDYNATGVVIGVEGNMCCVLLDEERTDTFGSYKVVGAYHCQLLPII